MSAGRHRYHLFALSAGPPEELAIAGRPYSLARVFKHDFWAATCLYESAPAAAVFPRAVVKFGRDHPFAGLPLQAVGEWLTAREEAIYARLKGVEGIPRWIARLSPRTCAIEYIDGRPLDHCDKPPAGFFDKLRTVIEAVHARGVAYVDANKKSNILVTADGRPALIDFQIAIARRPDWPFPFSSMVRTIVGYLQKKDIYHLCKHKRRLVPEQLTPEEEALSRRRGPLHRFHRRLTKPYRYLRRGYLRKKHRAGRLVSPTAALEDHRQPEKDSWKERSP